MIKRVHWETWSFDNMMKSHATTSKQHFDMTCEINSNSVKLIAKGKRQLTFMILRKHNLKLTLIYFHLANEVGCEK